jgi:hypothetical protein
MYCLHGLGAPPTGVSLSWQPEIEQTLEHPSDVLDYFMPKADVEARGLTPAFEKTCLPFTMAERALITVVDFKASK